jgi:DnaA family protein
LTIPLKLEGLNRFDNFFTGGNRELVERLRTLMEPAGPLGYWLWGEAGRGRSHLLQAACQEAENAGYRTAYLPLAALPKSPVILEGLDADLIALDDVDLWLGDRAFEAEVMALYQERLASSSRLIVAALENPQRAEFALADLASRMRALTGFEVLAPDDDGLRKILTSSAERQGLTLTPSVLDYWLHRSPRALPVLLEQLEQLDARALTEQRRVTIPLIKEVLAL